MKTCIECIPCFIRQSQEAARMVTEDERINREVVEEVTKYLVAGEITKSPPEISMEVHRIIREVTNCDDPYKDIKKQQNESALKFYPKLKKMIANSNDKLLTAVKLAIAGNVIDFGTSIRFDVKDTINEILNTNFTIDNYKRFKNSALNAKNILYIGDNAGEIVFDMPLVEELSVDGHKIIYAVRSGPIINDATVEDAIAVGMDKYAKIMETGTRCPGTVLELCSSEFIQHYKSSDIIIAKGQGNYEALGPAPNLFKLLMVKCDLIAQDLGGGVQVGDIVLIDGSE